MKWLTKRIEGLIFKFSLTLTKGKWQHLPLHLDYEAGKYRQGELKKIINDALPHFALTPNEFKEYTKTGDDGEKYRIAWSRISKRHKYSKGDYGELLLFLILKVFFKTETLVTKVKLKSGNQEVLGYDCAHFTIEKDEPILWLGESKFYANFSSALTSAFDSLQEHCNVTFTKGTEFSILEPNIEVNKNSKYYMELKTILKGVKSFDKLKIKIPVFITYDFDKIKNHKDISSVDFFSDFQTEYEAKRKSIENKTLKIPSNFELIFIILPLESVKNLKDEIEQLEAANR